MSSDVLIVLAPDLTVRWASAASAAVLGRDPAGLTGTSILEIVRDEDRGELERVLRADATEVAATGRPLMALAASGSAAWIEVRRRRVVDEAGGIGEIHLAANDVSLRVEFERERDAVSGVTDELAAMVEMADEVAREQAGLAEIARLVAREDAGMGEVMDLIAAQVGALSSAACATVARIDQDGLTTLVGCHGLGTPDQVTRIDPSGTLLERAVGDDAPVVSGPFRASTLLGDGRRAGIEYPNGLVAPIVVRGAVWGVLAVGGADIASQEQVLERVVRFAELAAAAVSSIEARELLVRRAETDPLTGLANHRTLQEALASAWALAQRDDSRMSLAMIDIDHFKRVNDNFGHGAGDEALRVVAERLRGLCLGDAELLGRTGGEEFAWLMPGRAEQEAVAFAEAARRAVAAAPITGVGTVTVSIGVCDSGLSSSPEDLLAGADAALYRAKEAGRNRVLAFRPGMGTDDEDSLDRAAREQAIGALRALARVVDAKDHDTHLHSERTAELADRLARMLGWDARAQERLRRAAHLHDLGKIGVPDAILLKPAALDEGEWRVMRTHPQLGAVIAGEVLDQEQASWIRHHHEHWDGSGYSSGLAGEDIPEGARIIAIASAWDAMTRPRRYGGELTREQALAELRRGRGRQFWPAAVDAMLDAIDVLDPLAEASVSGGSTVTGP
jgi:diguanylate cyclase (GGDEF)-like protein/PAS domain S-box-containing protein